LALKWALPHEERPDAASPHGERDASSRFARLVTSESARKPICKPVGQPLAQLVCKLLSHGAAYCFPLLGREHRKPVGNPVWKALMHLVRQSFPDGVANGGPLLRRELGKPVRKTSSDLT
jgi:hypothetical protein